MTTSPNEVINGVGAIGVPVTLFVYARLTRRLEGLSRMLTKHSKALSRLADSHKVVSRAVSTLTDDTEELEDAVGQLQTSTSVLKERLNQHEKWRKREK